jgi:hypothetical protein
MALGGASVFLGKERLLGEADDCGFMTAARSLWSPRVLPAELRSYTATTLTPHMLLQASIADAAIRDKNGRNRGSAELVECTMR